MLTWLIGTKAQLIKCAPVIRRARAESVPIRLISTGQHAATVAQLLIELDLPPLDGSLLQRSEDVTTLTGGGRWLARACYQMWLKRRAEWLAQLGGEQAIGLVHGDTVSTWLGMRMLRRCGIPVAHLEAGLSSGRWCSPFPEELVRRRVMRQADYLFAPGDWAVDNIRHAGYPGKVINIHSNTNHESLLDALDRSANSDFAPDLPARYLLVSLHRLETISRSSALQFFVQTLLRWADTIPIVFVVHRPTLVRLNKYHLHSTLEQRGIRLLPPQSYPNFVRLISAADGVLTDGGSVQEECYYLGKPCLIWRSHTERPEGLGENAVLSEFKETPINTFMQQMESFRRPPQPLEQSPAQQILDYLKQVLNNRT